MAYQVNQSPGYARSAERQDQNARLRNDDNNRKIPRGLVAERIEFFDSLLNTRSQIRRLTRSDDRVQIAGRKISISANPDVEGKVYESDPLSEDRKSTLEISVSSSSVDVTQDPGRNDSYPEQSVDINNGDNLEFLTLSVSPGTLQVVRRACELEWSFNDALFFAGLTKVQALRACYRGCLRAVVDTLLATFGSGCLGGFFGGVVCAIIWFAQSSGHEEAVDITTFSKFFIPGCASVTALSTCGFMSRYEYRRFIAGGYIGDIENRIEELRLQNMPHRHPWWVKLFDDIEDAPSLIEQRPLQPLRSSMMRAAGQIEQNMLDDRYIGDFANSISAPEEHVREYFQSIPELLRAYIQCSLERYAQTSDDPGEAEHGYISPEIQVVVR